MASLVHTSVTITEAAPGHGAQVTVTVCVTPRVTQLAPVPED